MDQFAQAHSPGLVTQIKLDVPESRHADLDATFEGFREAAQHVADAGWDDDPTQIEDTKNTLHEQTYTTTTT